MDLKTSHMRPEVIATPGVSFDKNGERKWVPVVVNGKKKELCVQEPRSVRELCTLRMRMGLSFP